MKTHAPKESESAKLAQWNALSCSQPKRARLVCRDSVAKPIANVLLTDRASSARGQGALAPRCHVDSGLESGDRSIPGGHGIDAHYKNVCNDTPNTFVKQRCKLTCMQTLGKAVKDLREARGWNQSELARRATRAGAKVTPQNIQQLEADGVSQPRYLPALAETLGMSVEELLQYTRIGVAARKERPADLLRSIHLWDSADELDPNALVELPRISLRLSGGKGGPDRDDNEREPQGQAFRASFAKAQGWKPTTHYSMRCEGSSMEPTIRDGSPVVVDITQQRIRSGDVYAVMIHGEPFIKRLFKLPNGMVSVRSDNTSRREFDAFDVPEESLEIIGRAVWTSSLL